MGKQRHFAVPQSTSNWSGGASGTGNAAAGGYGRSSGYGAAGAPGGGSSTRASAEHGRFVQSRFRCFVSETCSYDQVVTSLLDSDFLVDWEHVKRVDVLVEAARPIVCSICLDTELYVPRITKCGHCFCYACITRYLLRDEKTGNLQVALSSAGGWTASAGAGVNRASTSTSGDLHRVPATSSAGPKTQFGRKCPVCNKPCLSSDLRPCRFQYVTADANKRLVRVCKDPERPGIVCLGTATSLTFSASRRAALSHDVGGFATDLAHLPTGLPREGVDLGWHFSRLILASEEHLRHERKNDLLGLLKLSHETRRPDQFSGGFGGGGLADTEMLPFLDFLVQQELTQLGYSFLGPASAGGTSSLHHAREEFLRDNTLPRKSGKRTTENLFEDIVYDRKLHEVRVDFEGFVCELKEALLLVDGMSTAPKGRGTDRDAFGLTPVSGDLLVEEVVVTETTATAVASDTDHLHHHITIATRGRTDVPPAVAEVGDVVEGSQTPTPKLNSGEHEDDDDEWFSERAKPGSSGDAASASSSSARGSTGGGTADATTTGASSTTAASASSKNAVKTGTTTAPADDSLYYFYQAWDSQPIFVAPFFLNLLRDDGSLPLVLDLRDPDKCVPPIKASQVAPKKRPDNRFFGEKSDCVTMEARKTNSLFRRLPLRLEVTLLDFDASVYVSYDVYSKFQDEIWRRQTEKQHKKKRQKADEKWVAHRARNADEKLMEELKKQSWLHGGRHSEHVNFGSVPTKEDFGLSLEISKKVAIHEAKTKKKVTEEELAMIVSLHEDEMEKLAREKAAVSAARQEKIAADRARAAASAKETNGKKVVDGWGTDDDEDETDAQNHETPLRGPRQSDLHGMYAGDHGGASSSSAAPKWGEETTLAQRLAKQRQAAAAKKKEEEASKKYFPTLAETLGGKKMVAMGGGGGAKKKNKASGGFLAQAVQQATSTASKANQEKGTHAAALNNETDDYDLATGTTTPEVGPTGAKAKPDEAEASGVGAQKIVPEYDAAKYLQEHVAPHSPPSDPQTAPGGKGKKKKPQKIRLFG
mmetsp:Transcript_27831/g.70329  ORF Transcript_27831/g.70329 Transcript_27831/m.70329 type:complete len:1044 (+) Transcript_27831:323-3454(+)|eukprot:g484.t1